MRKSAVYGWSAVFILLILCACVWYAALYENRRERLSVSFLNVGQGDSIFIDAPSGRQVLIDGGANSSVLRQLSKVMPWFDRSIDVVIPTHPDADHIGGLIDVLARYDVSTIMESSVEGTTTTWATLERSIANAVRRGAKHIVAMRGDVIDLGGGAYLEILFPDRLVPHVETNDGSIVARLVYGKTSFLLTGDAPKGVENFLVHLDGDSLRADVLKAGHHGSKYSSSSIFLGFVSPQFGVFSRGCNNRYGHPATDVVTRFKQFDVSTFDTCMDGAVTFVSDGQTVREE